MSMKTLKEGKDYVTNSGLRFRCIRTEYSRKPRAVIVSLKTGNVFTAENTEILSNGHLTWFESYGRHFYGENPDDHRYGDRFFKDGYPWPERDAPEEQKEATEADPDEELG